MTPLLVNDYVLDVIIN